MSEQTSEKKLFLLDAMALIYRAYYAFIKRPLYNSKGMNTSAILGFTNTLYDLLEKENPSHIAVAFDTLAPTERQIAYADYKAQREETPEDIVQSLSPIKSIIQAFHIPTVEKDGYEADDLIGTLAKKAEKKGYEVYMVTSDKDFAQLVSENIFMYKPARPGGDVEILGVEKVLKKWKLNNVSQMIDLLGMQGDTSDNIPGIPGVGPKTAQKLLAEYGSLEKVLEHAEAIKGKLGEKITANADQARTSKELATIICDVPVEFDEQAFQRDPPDKQALNKLFTELEFRTLGKRILGEEFTVSESSNNQMGLFDKPEAETEKSDAPLDTGKNLNNTDHTYHLADTTDKQKELVRKLLKQERFCVDTETSSLNPHEAELVGLAFSFKPHTAWYVPVPASEEAARKVVDTFRPALESDTIEKVAQNLKYDMLILLRYGVMLREPCFDTMVAHYLIEPEGRHSMDRMAETYLSYSPRSIESLIGKKGKSQGNMRDVPVEEVKEYAGEDADITLQLREVLIRDLRERKLYELFEVIESPLVPVLAMMEHEGVAIDKTALATYSKALAKELTILEKAIFEIAGVAFNLSSPKQLGDVLFKRLKLEENPKKTRTGQFKTNEEVLTKLARKHVIAQKILDYRELSKLKSTYVDALPKLINTHTGRVHTTFNQTVASTGRLSSTNPNLQNIPIRTEKGRMIRKAFVPRDKDYVLLAADYSQVELRLVAAVSDDKNMISDFREGRDIHAATAARIFDVAPDEVTPEMRRDAKTVNFGLIYGISAFGLAQRLDIPQEEAQHRIDQYFAKYPGVAKYMDHAIAFAREHGYVQTLKGRRRYLPDINSRNGTVRGFAERTAINAPIQGTAADMIKIAMNEIHRAMQAKPWKSKMTLQVHDELVFDAHRDEVNDLTPLVVEKMKSAIELEVPVVVDTGIGENWLEAH